MASLFASAGLIFISALVWFSPAGLGGSGLGSSAVQSKAPANPCGGRIGAATSWPRRTIVLGVTKCKGGIGSDTLELPRRLVRSIRREANALSAPRMRTELETFRKCFAAGLQSPTPLGN